jgi:hypothetical protein
MFGIAGSRNLRGVMNQQLVESLLLKLKDRGFIKDYETPFNIQYPEYPREDFYFTFSITFSDDTKWIIQTTTCYPRERRHGYQWNAFHSKRLDSYIERAYVVYPDSMRRDQIRSCMTYNRKIVRDEMFSALDGMISFAELYFLIEEKAFEHLKIQSKKAKQGNAFERYLVDILTHPNNQIIWNGVGDKELGFNYPYFAKMITKFGLTPEDIIEMIDATENIDLLPPRPGKRRGGKPKTDIKVDIKLEHEEVIRTFTISSKRSSSDWVAINEYPADYYIHVLQIEEEDLKEALFELERVGAPTLIDKRYQNIIEEKLPRYYEALAKWGYAGIGGEGDPKVHWAEYFTIFKNETKELEIYHLDEYIAKIFTEVRGQLGSPFTFTYTGDRGTNIQLRGKMI